MVKSKKLSTKLFRLCSDESIISHSRILNRYSLFCVYKKTGMKVGIFELKNNKVCFKYEFMDKQFTKVMKGITIIMVFFSHVGNANNVRLFAPLGGVQFF